MARGTVQQAKAKGDGLSRYTGWVEDMLAGYEPQCIETIKGYVFGKVEKDRFIKTLQSEFGLYLTCAVEGVAPQVVEYHLKNDPVFRAAVDRVHAQHVEQLERSAFGRALSRSDTLAIFMLKAMRPDVYGERASELTVTAKVTVNLGSAKKSDDAENVTIDAEYAESQSEDS